MAIRRADVKSWQKVFEEYEELLALRRCQDNSGKYTILYTHALANVKYRTNIKHKCSKAFLAKSQKDHTDLFYL